MGSSIVRVSIETKYLLLVLSSINLSLPESGGCEWPEKAECKLSIIFDLLNVDSLSR
jgi:hypothetical protein